VPGGARNAYFGLVECFWLFSLQPRVFEPADISLKARTQKKRVAPSGMIEKWSGFGEKTNIMMAVFAF
jgi:hypothetical protein